MHKTLLLLGLLRHGPMSGYDLHRIVRAYGELYTDLKKANVYYLLERLAADGFLAVRAEAGARGPRRERLIYSLTAAGQARFYDLLREVLRSFEPAHTGVDVAVVLLRSLPQDEAQSLLEGRRQAVAARRRQVAAEWGDETGGSVLEQIARDHLLSLIDAELAWVERALKRLGEQGWEDEPASHMLSC